MRSSVLDELAYDLGDLEIRSNGCSTGNGDFLAAQTLQTILVEIKESA